jgi:NAD+ diphosphatase
VLKTPDHFTPLFDCQDCADPLTFLFHGDALLLRGNELADSALALALPGQSGRLMPVGELGGRYCQVAWLEAPCEAPPGHAWVRLRAALFGALGEVEAGVAARAFQVAEWARTHRFCGACCSPTSAVAGERCMRCTQCGHIAYPRISPAMMVLIRKGDHVLLALHKNGSTGRFTPLAGFLEAGESVEEAIHREVFEEVGLRVHNLQYFSSQSWPFPHSLMLAFTADYLDGEIRVDASEIAEARWFGPGDDWPEQVKVVSVSSALLDAHRPPR